MTKALLKKLIFAAVGIFVVYYFGGRFYGQLVTEPLRQDKKRITDLQKGTDLQIGIEAYEAYFKAYPPDVDILARWKQRALPAVEASAETEYHYWLNDLVDSIEFAETNIRPFEPTNYRGYAFAVNFEVSARGTLDQLSHFLFEFYNAVHLQKVTAINIAPLPGGEQFVFTITIQALGLRQNDESRWYTLAEGTWPYRLASASLEEYDVIGERNFFTTSSARMAATRFAVLTAVNTVDGQGEAWFTLTMERKLLKLRVGDSISVGDFDGTIAEVDGSDVILADGEERWLLTVGESLAQALSLPPEM